MILYLALKPIGAKGIPSNIICCPTTSNLHLGWWGDLMCVKTSSFGKNAGRRRQWKNNFELTFWTQEKLILASLVENLYGNDLNQTFGLHWLTMSQLLIGRMRLLPQKMINTLIWTVLRNLYGNGIFSSVENESMHRFGVISFASKRIRGKEVL